MPVAEKVINIPKHRIGGIPSSIRYFGKQSNKNFNCKIIPSSVIITLITVSGERSLTLLRKTSITSVFSLSEMHQATG